MLNRQSRAVLKRAGWSSVSVAKPICVSPLECPSENTWWSWEGDESPLASTQLSCRGASPPSYQALSSPLLSFPQHGTPPPPLPYFMCSAQTFPGYAVAQMSLCAHSAQSLTTQNHSSISSSKEYKGN